MREHSHKRLDHAAHDGAPRGGLDMQELAQLAASSSVTVSERAVIRARRQGAEVLWSAGASWGAASAAANLQQQAEGGTRQVPVWFQ